MTIAITNDIRITSPIIIEYGIRSSDITQRVATGGNMSFELDNTPRNVGGVAGYYSPDHANAASGFVIGKEIKLKITYSGSVFAKFVGNIEDIDPVPGKHNEQSVRVTAVDWMAHAARYKVNAAIPVQVNKRMDQIIATSLSSITEQPTTTSLAAGRDTFTYALDSGRAKQTTMIRLLQKLAESELSYVYVIGNSGSGGQLTSESRHSRILRTTSSASINDTMVNLQLGQKRDRIKNIIRVRTHPREVDSSASDLFSLNYTPEVRGGDSIVITGEYADPTNSQRPIGGASVIFPIAGIDYTMNTNSDGSGTDVTYDQKGKIISVAAASSNIIGYWMLADIAGTTNVKEETDAYHNKYGAACDIAFGGTGIGDGRTSACIQAASSYINIFSTNLDNDFSGLEGTLSHWVKAAASTFWDEEAIRGIVQLRADTNNLLIHLKDNGGNLAWQFREGGAACSYSISRSDTAWNHMATTWSKSASKLRFYHNGIEGASKAFTGAWAGSLNSAQCVIGAADTTSGAYGWDGSIQHVAIYNEALTAASILAIYNAGSGGFNVDTEIGGFATEFNITNQEKSPAYITKLEVRGRRVKDFQPITQMAEDTSSQSSYGDLELFWDMPFQENPLVGKDAAEFFLTNLKDPSTDIEKVEFLANSASELMIAMLDIEPGDRVRIQETISGIDTDFFVNGVRLKITKPENIWCTWYVTPANDVSFWAIGTAGFSEIGETTYTTY
jgi:hypothetical protein